MKLSVFGRFYLMRYKNGKEDIPEIYLKEVMDYIKWEEEQENK